MLIDLARGHVVLTSSRSRSENLEGWDALFKTAGLPPPDGTTLNFANQQLQFSWRAHFVAATISPISDEARNLANAKGWSVFELPENLDAGLPASLISVFQG